MSRYGCSWKSGELDEDDDPIVYTLVYGYDQSLQEYFINLRKGDEFVFRIGSKYSMLDHPDYPGRINWTNTELLEILLQHEKFVPKEHLQALALDLPF